MKKVRGKRKEGRRRKERNIKMRLVCSVDSFIHEYKQDGLKFLSGRRNEEST